jgi:hypothetical protein
MAPSVQGIAGEQGFRRTRRLQDRVLNSPCFNGLTPNRAFDAFDGGSERHIKATGPKSNAE